MGRYDDIKPEELRRTLVRVARLILRLDEEGTLLRQAPRLQKLLGDLRQRLFAYEVRSAADLGPHDGSGERAAEEDGPEADPLLRESNRVVEEARKREEQFREELEGGRAEDEDEDD